jgi:hypothetical protein
MESPGGRRSAGRRASGWRTSFVGRDGEIARIGDLLSSWRIVTLTGAETLPGP